MQTQIRQYGDISIISIHGSMPIDRAQMFRDICLKHLINAPIVFNLEKAHFVGSTGLTPFFETVEKLAQSKPGSVKFVGAKVEFHRLLSNMELPGVEFHQSEMEALKSFNPSNL